MTIIEALNAIDDIYPNTCTQEEKIAWLSTLDEKVKKNVIDTHEDGESVSFERYTTKTPLDTELLIPSPYTDVYLYWLQAKIDYWNGEMGRYNNSISNYNAEYTAFANAYNREHRPIAKTLKFF